jgi:cell division septum initiation protein DivIVA
MSTDYQLDPGFPVYGLDDIERLQKEKEDLAEAVSALRQSLAHAREALGQALLACNSGRNALRDEDVLRLVSMLPCHRGVLVARFAAEALDAAVKAAAEAMWDR